MGMTATTDQNFFTCTQSTKPRMRLNLKPAPTSNCAYQRDRTNCSCRPATRKPTQAAKVCAETYARAEELAGSRRRSRRRMLKANHAWIQPRGPWSSPAGQLAEGGRANHHELFFFFCPRSGIHRDSRQHALVSSSYCVRQRLVHRRELAHDLPASGSACFCAVMATCALFTYKIFYKIEIIAFLFVFDKYYSIMD